MFCIIYVKNELYRFFKHSTILKATIIYKYAFNINFELPTRFIFYKIRVSVGSAV